MPRSLIPHLAAPAIASVLALSALAGCGGDEGTSATTNPSGGGGSGGTGGAGTGGSGAGGTGGSSSDVIRFAAIGDFGNDSTDEGRVADLVKSWNVDFVITMGDNNYPDGEAITIDDNIGKYYAEFIGDYTGAYAPGSATNRFWPSPGNHDWHAPGLVPYLDYFTLPGNERYYDVDLGLVHLFAVDSDSAEPDGNTDDSAQGAWLQQQLAASTSCYDVVYFHHAAYSSAEHGSNLTLRWPYEAWGADVVMAGHDHSYERLAVGGIPYFVNGLGGAGLYNFVNIEPESQVRYNADHGAMLVTADKTEIRFQFYSADSVLVDELAVPKSCP